MSVHHAFHAFLVCHGHAPIGTLVLAPSFRRALGQLSIRVVGEFDLQQMTGDVREIYRQGLFE